LPKYYNAENSFLTVSYIESAYYTTKNAYGFTAIELSVWFCSDKWLKKKNGNPYENRQSVIDAHLKHTDDYEKPFKQEYPNLLDGDDSEYKISGRFWAPGVFKNFIQRANRAVEEGKDFGYGFPFIDKEQLKKLKTDTLFMPKWIETAAENTDLLSKYPYPYAFISYKKLNHRILYSKTPFYYVNFMEAKLYRVVSVINGQTGEVVFAKNYLVLNSFRKGDLEDIADAIPKK
jgi:hypothetical protein